MALNQMENSMQVVKRDGRREDVAFEKVQQRIVKQSEGLSVNAVKVAQGVLARIVDGITTTELDNIAANLAYSWSTTHPDYGVLAGRIALSNHQRNTPARFVDVIERLDAVKDRAGNPASMLDPEFVRVVRENADRIESRINYSRDFLLDYFGFKTLEKAYLLRDTDRRIVERPQHLWMRVSIGLWVNDLEKAFETYDMMSQKLYTHATPTLFNAGTKRPQLSSCFVAGTPVHTMNGVKNIEEVVIGDEVVTHLGNVKRVLQIHRNALGDRKLYDIKIAGSPKISVTDNHRLWSISSEQEVWGEKPGWNSVGYLRTGDWVAIPKKTGGEPYVMDVKNVLDTMKTDGNNINYQFEYTDTQVFPTAVWKRKLASGEERECKKPSKPFNRFWTFDDTMMELLGIWYGDGCVSHEKNSAREPKPKSINIVSYHNNTTLIDFVTSTFVEKLGISHLTVSKDAHNMVCMAVNNQYIAYIFKNVFKSGFDGKRLPAFFNKLGYSQILSFLSGLISSDGCVTKDGVINVQLTNPPLINDIYHLARSVGIPITNTFMHNYNKKDLKPTGRLSFPPQLFVEKIKKYYSDERLSLLSKSSSWNNVRIIEDITFLRINGKTPSESRPETVYTLGIEDDHSYSVGGIIAENCFLLAMNDDSIKGIYKTLEDCALISQYGGGIGIHCSNVRAKGSLIRGTGGISNGLVPMLRVFNNTARYVDQCFAPDTIVYTNNGPKRIADVAITDKVLTSDGNYNSVIKPVRHDYKGKILEFGLKYGISSVMVTPEHPILALCDQKKGLNFNVIRNRIDKELVEIDYTEAKDLRVDDFIAFPIPKYECDISSITPSDCRFYGIMLGDGYISNELSGITLNKTTKTETRRFVETYLEDHAITYYKYEDEETNTVRIKWTNTQSGFKFTKSQLYDVANEKHMDVGFLHLPIPKIKQILFGLIETDGCIGTKEVSIELSSFNLIESIRYMILRLGALCSGYDRNRVGNVSSYKEITTKKPTKVIRIPRITAITEMFPDAPESEYVSFLKHGDYVYSRIESISEHDYEGTLHDFEIDSVHDYTIAHLGLAHNGGGKRNGSFAMYLEPWHADIQEFLELKKNTGSEEERARDLFYALWIPDLFMERVDANGDWTLFCPNEAPGLADVVGDEFKALYEKYEAEGRGRRTIKAQKLWFQILDSQIETGTPYLCYKDAANKKSNQQNLGVIKSSNLCVAPETLVYTKSGIKPIRELVNTDIEVWNGDKWSNTRVVQTGSSQKLIQIKLSNGAVIDCTPYHKFLITESYYDKKSIKDSLRIDAIDLKPGMKLHKWNNTVIEGDKSQDIKYAYTHGFFCGDGTYSNKRPGCSLYGDKKELLAHLDIKSTSGVPDATGRINTVLPEDLAPKFVVPINASLECRLRWLEGILDADGSVARNGDNESFQIGSINIEFLNNIRIMLMGMGVNAKVTKEFGVRKTLLPDGRGGKKLFDCKELWRLLISSSGLYTLVQMGLNPKRLTISGNKPQRCAEQYVQIVSVEDNGRIDDTYCFNEPENHAGMFNGVLTGNCSEIIEYSSPEETAVCNLASMSLPAFVHDGSFDFKQFRAAVRVAVRNLNRVIDINFYPTPEAHRSNMRHRPIGLGIQGLADVFAMLRLPWESEDAAKLNKRIFAHMYYAALESSCDLAAKEGTYETYVGSPAWKGKFQPQLWNVAPLEDEGLDWDTLFHSISRIGLRNSLLVSPMPTASTSQILGNCECIEPYATHIFTRRTLAGEFIILNKHLVAALIERGIWSTEVKDAIIGNNGSVAGLPMIPDDLQAIFKTVWEIKQKTLIDMAADRGPYVCQSQSLNLFMGDPDYRKLTSMHFYAWRRGLKTGIYYLRTRAAASAQKFTVEPVRAVGGGGATGAPKEEEGCVMCSS